MSFWAPKNLVTKKSHDLYSTNCTIVNCVVTWSSKDCKRHVYTYQTAERYTVCGLKGRQWICAPFPITYSCSPSSKCLERHTKGVPVKNGILVMSLSKLKYWAIAAITTQSITMKEWALFLWTTKGMLMLTGVLATTSCHIANRL